MRAVELGWQKDVRQKMNADDSLFFATHFFAVPGARLCSEFSRPLQKLPEI